MVALVYRDWSIAVVDSPNKAVVRRIIEEIWNGRDTSKAHDLITREVRDHNLGPGESGGLDGFIAHHRDFMTGSSDLYITVEDLIEEGDRVVARLTWRGTHDGSLFGIPSSGKFLTVTNITIYRLAEGKVIDVWRNQDALGMMEQIGVAPPRGTGPLGILGHVIANFVRTGVRQMVTARRKTGPSGMPSR
jgi:steroid delta-isomerase-like uncharacterized protein